MEHEIYSLYNEPNVLVEYTTIRRLGWAGHITRMEEGRIPTPPLQKKMF